MKHNILNRISRGFLLLAACLALGACSENLFDESSSHKGGITLTMSCVDMLPQFTAPDTPLSRAGGPKNGAEKKINTLHLFFFDATTGEFLTPQAGDINFQPYQVITSNVITIPDNAFTQMNNVRVVAIANINGTDVADGNHFYTRWTTGGRIENGTRDTNTPYEIKNYESLRNWTYAPLLRTKEPEKLSIKDLPSAGMPMIGVSDPINLNQPDGSGLNRREIQLKALMARVNISVKLTPNQESLDGNLPSMTITGYGIKNMPKTVRFLQPAGAGENSLTDGEVEDVEYVLPDPVTINKSSDPVVFTYYTYENIQLPDFSARRPGGEAFFPNGAGSEPVYPDGVEGNDRQRWKPRMARTDRASALVLKGNYITHQGLNYKAQFTVYMGANPNDDFKVERNHEYNNNITVHGLDYVRNSQDNVYNFDGRVNVISDNPVYLAIVNERKVDAHATALPMDVWLLLREPQIGETTPPVVTHNSRVTVEIPDDVDWLRMVMIPRAEMERKGFAAGAGAEPYFYTDMFTLIDNGTLLTNNPQPALADHDATGLQCGKRVVINSTPQLNNSRSRIYFYIDENVAPNAAGDVPDRVANIKIIYENNLDGGDRRERTLQIEQRGLVHVNGRHTGGDNINTYMEYYEEYLEHNDPLDQHLQPGELYEGLPWGLYRSSVADLLRNWFSGPWGHSIYLTDDAFNYTKAILKQGEGGSLSGLYLFNEIQPTSIFHYCYGRNKRDHNGNVDLDAGKGWYVPGIRELERALVQYYLTFSDFHNPDNLYLSASCGKQDAVLESNKELTTHARATRVTISSTGQPQYVESGVAGSPGSVLRTEPRRIRAFYKQ